MRVSELEGRGVAWTEERGTSDEGPPPQAARQARRRLKAPRKRAEDTSDKIGPNEPGGALVPLDCPPGRTQWTFSHAGRSYAVFEVDGELRVTDGACPHNGGPLAEGLVRDGVVRLLPLGDPGERPRLAAVSGCR
jgi:hypothetical protein